MTHSTASPTALERSFVVDAALPPSRCGHDRVLTWALLVLLARPVVRTGPLAVDLASGEVRVAGRSVRLSAHETLLVALLARQVGEVVPNGLLARRLWGATAMEPSLVRFSRHHLRVITCRLRKRLGDHRDLIETVLDVGLRLRDLPVEVE